MRRKNRPDKDLEIPRGIDAQAIARDMERDHGCEGITVDQTTGKVHGLRYRDDVATTTVTRDLNALVEQQRRRRAAGPRIYSIPGMKRGRKG